MKHSVGMMRLFALCAGFALRLFSSAAGASEPSLPDGATTSLEETASRSAPEYQALLALSRQTPDGLAKIYERNRRLHDEALRFMEKYPDDPLRWDAVVLLRFGAGFSKVIEENGQRKTVPDPEEERAWLANFKTLMADLLESPDASDSSRKTALEFLIRQHTDRITRHRSVEPVAELEGLKLRFSELERRYPASREYVSACRSYADALDVADLPGCFEFLVRLLDERQSDQYPDPLLREIANSHLRTLRDQKGPVSAKLTSLDGSVIELDSFRGKVILVAFAPIDAPPDIAELLRLYRTYHASGLEVLQLPTIWNLSDARRSGDLEKFREAGRRAELPWPIVYSDEKGLPRGLAERFGINFGPAWLIIARDGRLAISPAPMPLRDLEKTIRTEIEVSTPARHP